MGSLACRAGENKNLLQNSTYGLSALKTLLDSILTDTGTTLEAKLDTIDTIVDSILTDTGTTLEAKLDTIDTIVDAIAASYKRSERIHFGASTAVTAGSTTYLTCYSAIHAVLASSATEYVYTTLLLITRAGTFKNLVCACESAPGNGQTFTYTVRKNGSNTSLAVTISGATDKIGSNIVNTVSVAVGDYITVSLVTSAGAAADQHLATVDFEG